MNPDLTSRVPAGGRGRNERIQAAGRGAEARAGEGWSGLGREGGSQATHASAHLGGLFERGRFGGGRSRYVGTAMRRLERSLAVTAAVMLSSLLASLHATPASADLPPPDGVKFVDFAIAVENLAAFPDVVVVAYPWSLSNGAPTTEHAVLKDGQPLEIGRRSPTPKLWAVKKADYEAFAASHKPTHEYQDGPLEAFFKSGKAIACDASVEPDHQLPESDARDRIVQAFRADAIDATRCQLVATGDRKATAASAPPGAGHRRRGAPPGERTCRGRGRLRGVCGQPAGRRARPGLLGDGGGRDRRLPPATPPTLRPETYASSSASGPCTRSS